MATRWYIVLLLIIVGVSLPLAPDGGWGAPIEFFPMWFAAILLAQVIAFRLFGVEVSVSSELEKEENR